MWWDVLCKELCILWYRVPLLQGLWFVCVSHVCFLKQSGDTHGEEGGGCPEIISTFAGTLPHLV